MNNYKIYALKYAGPLTKSGAHFLWQKNWDKKQNGNFYFWLIKNHDRMIIFDTGVNEKLAKEKNLPNYIKPNDLLSKINIDAKKISDIVISHMHWDHLGGLEFFPNAKFYISKNEFEFWTKNKIVKTDPFKLLSDTKSINYTKKLYKQKKIILINQEKEIFPGIKTIFAPGHSPALMALAIETKKGKAILASDSCYSFDNIKLNWPSDVIFNIKDSVETINKLKSLSDEKLIFPGHDIKLATKYPKIAKNITRLA